MELEFINVNQICSLKCSPIRKNSYYEYRESKTKKSLFGKTKQTKEGFYYCDSFYSIRHLQNDNSLFIKGKNVFRRPYIEVKMSNKDTHTKWFKTNDEMFEFLFKSHLSKLYCINIKDTLESRSVLLEKFKGYPDEYRIISKNTLEREAY